MAALDCYGTRRRVPKTTQVPGALRRKKVVGGRTDGGKRGAAGGFSRFSMSTFGIAPKTLALAVDLGAFRSLSSTRGTTG